MPDTYGNTFQYRQNRNGTHDSICCSCFLTVASVAQASGLRELERTHICDPIQLGEVMEYSNRLLKDLQRITAAANKLMDIGRAA
jgi:hypothetical protein